MNTHGKIILLVGDGSATFSQFTGGPDHVARLTNEGHRLHLMKIEKRRFSDGAHALSLKILERAIELNADFICLSSQLSSFTYLLSFYLQGAITEHSSLQEIRREQKEPLSAPINVEIEYIGHRELPYPSQLFADMVATTNFHYYPTVEKMLVATAA
jgi:hypothetical protein